MDLWIRSQDKKQLELVERVGIVHKVKRSSILDNIEIKEECSILVNGGEFGEYRTEQRAIEILDKIQGLLVDRYVMDTKFSFVGKALPRTCIVYQMPADKGVEDD